ncbi:MAG TPA: TOBE domain-containing protein, partial [Puia sp.]
FGKYNLIDGKIIRPEQVAVFSTMQPRALKGRVETVSFWGSFYEAAVLTDSGLRLTVRVWGAGLAAGEVVYVTVP